MQATGYDLIYADPPWTYGDVRTGGSRKSGAAQVYETMTAAEIAALPVASLAAPNCLLAMWTTNPLLDVGIDTVRAWGFEYVTDWPWRKLGRLGLGMWGRCNVEHLLIGRRGRVQPPRFGTETSILDAGVSEHSRKPAEARARLERAASRAFGTWRTVQVPAEGRTKKTIVLEAERPFAEIRAIELFARESVPGWDALGFGVGSESIEQAIARMAGGLL